MSGGTALHWQLRAAAIAAAEGGGRSALRHFRRSGLAVEWKSDESPVTVADRDAEAACREVIATTFPEDGWLGEETGESRSESGRSWIVDPIDGTRNFVRGIPLWSTLVACEETDSTGVRRVVASAVAIPALQETYDAVRGGGARCNGVAIAVSPVTLMSDALFCYETPAWFIDHGLGRVFEALCRGSGLQRGGGDAFYHMLVASGRAEIVVEPKLAVWDVAATSLIVEEAGGRFSDLRGKHDIRAGNAVITNGQLHAETIATIQALRS
jgi:myo-inositol-1(or 4)-monophosphatase